MSVIKPFYFRQRVGHINWKLLSEIDLLSVLERTRVEPLQEVLDSLTFSEYSENDVKKNSIQATAKLVQVMQLIIEYLLYSQESQCKAIQQYHSKHQSLKQKNQLIKRENLALKEDCKIYQRQLSLLQQSVLKQQTLLRNPTEPLDPVIIGDSRSKNEKKEPSKDAELVRITDSLLRLERETRDFFKDILDNQRHTFLDELHRFMDLTTSQTEEQRKNAEVDLKFQMEAVVEVAKNAIEKSMQALEKQAVVKTEQIHSITSELNQLRYSFIGQESSGLAPMRSSSGGGGGGGVGGDAASRGELLTGTPQSNANNPLELQLRDKELKLQEYERQLQDRTVQLQRSVAEREADLQRREARMEREIEKASMRASRTLSSGSAAAGERALAKVPLVDIGREVLEVQLEKSVHKSSLLAFLVHLATKTCTLHHRHLRLKTGFLAWRVAAVAEAGAELDAERQRLRRELEGAMEREAELDKKLQAEKQRLVVESARYNSLVRKSETDRQQMEAVATEKVSLENTVLLLKASLCSLREHFNHLQSINQKRFYDLLTIQDGPVAVDGRNPEEMLERALQRIDRDTQLEEREQITPVLARELARRLNPNG